MDFDCFFDEFRKMEMSLGDRINGRHRGLESRTEDHFFTTEYATDEGPLFDKEPDQEGPLFDSYLANLDDAPVFDSDPDDLDNGPVFDAEPIPDHVAVHMCELAKLALNVSLDEGLLLAEKHTQVDVASSIVTQVIFSSDIAAPATTIDTPARCSPKCLLLAVHAEKTLISMGDCGELFLDDGGVPIPIHGIIRSDSVAVIWFESKYWDPGLAAELEFMATSQSHAAFHWDPGLLEGLQSIGFPGFASAYFHGLHILWLAQGKCGGFWMSLFQIQLLVISGSIMTCLVLAYGTYGAQWQSVEIVLSTVEIASSVDGQLEAVYVDNLYVASCQAHSLSVYRSHWLAAQDISDNKGCQYGSDEKLMQPNAGFHVTDVGSYSYEECLVSYWDIVPCLVCVVDRVQFAARQRVSGLDAAIDDREQTVYQILNEMNSLEELFSGMQWIFYSAQPCLWLPGAAAVGRESPSSMRLIAQLQVNDILLQWDSGSSPTLVGNHLAATLCGIFPKLQDGSRMLVYGFFEEDMISKELSKNNGSNEVLLDADAPEDDKLIVNCTRLQGFLVFNAIGDGTGSGLDMASTKIVALTSMQHCSAIFLAEFHSEVDKCRERLTETSDKSLHTLFIALHTTLLKWEVSLTNVGGLQNEQFTQDENSYETLFGRLTEVDVENAEWTEDFSYQFINSYKKASNMYWLNSDCMLCVCTPTIFLPWDFSFSTIERIVSTFIITWFAGLHTGEWRREKGCVNIQKVIPSMNNTRFMEVNTDWPIISASLMLNGRSLSQLWSLLIDIKVTLLDSNYLKALFNVAALGLDSDGEFLLCIKHQPIFWNPAEVKQKMTRRRVCCANAWCCLGTSNVLAGR